MKKRQFFWMLLVLVGLVSCKESERVTYARDVVDRYMKATYILPDSLTIFKEKYKQIDDIVVRAEVAFEYRAPFTGLVSDTVTLEIGDKTLWGKPVFYVDGRQAMFETLYTHPHGEDVATEVVYFPTTPFTQFDPINSNE